MIIAIIDELDGTESFRIVNGKMRFDVQEKLLRENGGGIIPVNVVGGAEGEIIVPGETGGKPKLRLKTIIHRDDL